MPKIEYIRASQRESNHKLWGWLDGVRRQIDSRSRVLGWLWWGLSWIVFGVVYLVSWLALVVALFRDVKFTLHFMEWEIAKLPPEGAHSYLAGKQQDYTRRLSYGSVPVREQKRIDKTFEYLFAKYPAPVVPSAGEVSPDPSAERHERMIETITGVRTAIERSTANDNELREKEMERHAQVMGGINEARTKINGVADYTDRKEREDAEREKKEAEALAAAEKRREQSRSRSGFEPHPKDFSPKLSDAQFVLLTRHMNEIGVFRRDVTQEEITRLFLCEHTEPLQTAHNRIIAMILEKLCAEGLITPKWQRVAADKKCFTSKHGKPLTAKDLSAGKQTAELMPEKKYEKIIEGIEAVKRAQ